MSSLYIHIPFCQKACHYCSFYFVLSRVKKVEFMTALCREIEQRHTEISDAKITSIYIGGGTPSLLDREDLTQLFDTIHKNYSIESDAEISIETNPENLSKDYIKLLQSLSINRLSIGVQSFFDEDLHLMNRNHNASQAMEAIENAVKIFDNVSLDLMFGLPYSGLQRWRDNLKFATDLGVRHISTYNLTIEEKTALERKVKRNELKIEEDTTLNEMYLYTIDYLTCKGFTQYEISNFGIENYWSQHNIGYWKGIYYLGFGPSAHSYNGTSRRWNISNLNNYITALSNSKNYCEIEALTPHNLYNEYVLTRLRTIFGVDISEIKANFGNPFASYFEKEAETFIKQNQLIQADNIYKLTRAGMLIADYIASELMMS